MMTDGVPPPVVASHRVMVDGYGTPGISEICDIVSLRTDATVPVPYCIVTVPARYPIITRYPVAARRLNIIRCLIDTWCLITARYPITTRCLVAARYLITTRRFACVVLPARRAFSLSEAVCVPAIIMLLFHRPDHTFDEGDLVLVQAVFLVQHLVGPGVGEVLEGDELEFVFGKIN